MGILQKKPNSDLLASERGYIRVDPSRDTLKIKDY